MDHWSRRYSTWTKCSDSRACHFPKFPQVDTSRSIRTLLPPPAPLPLPPSLIACVSPFLLFPIFSAVVAGTNANSASSSRQLLAAAASVLRSPASVPCMCPCFRSGPFPVYQYLLVPECLRTYSRILPDASFPGLPWPPLAPILRSSNRTTTPTLILFWTVSRWWNMPLPRSSGRCYLLEQ